MPGAGRATATSGLRASTAFSSTTTDSVWLAGNGDNDSQILKFTLDGKFLLQIGRSGQSRGSNDTANLGSPADLSVDAAAHEVYVADGYRNRRVIVFDSETGAYKRHWGAYGGRPSDEPTPAYDPAAAPSRQFGNPGALRAADA